jgi:hypothetical protein
MSDAAVNERRRGIARSVRLGGQRVDLLDRARLLRAIDDALAGRRRQGGDPAVA